MLICLQQLWESLADVFLLDSWQQRQRKERFQPPFFPKDIDAGLVFKACNQLQDIIVLFDQNQKYFINPYGKITAAPKQIEYK